MGRPSRCTPQQRRTLARLKTVPSLGQVHLEGGTAIALRLGNRESLDLEAFSWQRAHALVARK